ncbi:MAG: hypothetical protein EON87_03760 [Brevundimonas sp.]|nr:MAG: hypothetical protein EON87_03760 [Brevundimonas sp.]
MKRAICIAALVALGGCMPEPERPARDVAGNATGWTQPPRIDAVRRVQASLVFSGLAEPGARVVLRNNEGAAYAAAADAEGRFEIRMAVPSGSLLLRPETQVGQDAATSPDRLLIVDGGRGPIAILRSGGPTRRLDAAPALGAIDSDAQSLLASGRSNAAGSPVAVSAGADALQVAAGQDGRWSVLLGPIAPNGVVRVGDAAFVWPGPGASDAELQVERAGEGWRIGWTGVRGARQWSWLPDAATAS